MNPTRSYLTGIRIVLITVVGSALVCGIGMMSSPPAQRAAASLSGQDFFVGPFSLVESSGAIVTDQTLADRVWIASFIFTRCPLSCPRISSVMKSLQETLEGSGVLLVSITVDPEHDNPEVLRAYAARFSAQPDRWWFLTGDRDAIYALIRERFKLSVAPNPEFNLGGEGEEIAHSDRLALVDRGRIVGLFDSSDPSAVATLAQQARRRSLPDWIRVLPSVNASLNGLCAVFLVAGWILIRRRSPGRGEPFSLLAQPRVRGHVACMIAAVVTSAIFLSCYLVYHYQAGSVSFQGRGWIRMLYFTILLSHTLLATFGVLPLVILTLLRAIRRDFARHLQVAAVTIPIWLYVSITGVVIYLMLYHLSFSPGMDHESAAVALASVGIPAVILL